MGENDPLGASADVHPSHSVKLYDKDEFICEAAGEFLAAALMAGEPAVAIVTAVHRRGISAYMRSHGHDAEGAARHGRLRWVDAREMLSTFLIDGMPDQMLFCRHVGGILQQARTGEAQVPIRAFGEMVDVLLKDGNPEAALRVERLWNSLGEACNFSLLCAYATGNLYREENWRYFPRIRAEHDSVPAPAMTVAERRRALLDNHVDTCVMFDAVRGIQVLSDSETQHLQICEECQEVWHAFARQRFASA